MSYVEELEKRVEELQKQLAEATIWIPFWQRVDNDNWIYVRGPVSYGKIILNNNEYLASCIAGTIVIFYSIEDAKAHIELTVKAYLHREQ